MCLIVSHVHMVVVTVDVENRVTEYHSVPREVLPCGTHLYDLRFP